MAQALLEARAEPVLEAASTSVEDLTALATLVPALMARAVLAWVAFSALVEGSMPQVTLALVVMPVLRAQAREVPASADLLVWAEV